MSERYVKLFTLSKNLYSENSPVVILAGALLKDNKTDKVLMQLKIKNISNKRIIAVKVAIYQYDIAGVAIDKEVDFEYLDLSVKRDEEFGQKIPVFLSDNTTRSVKIEVTKVVFDDKTVWCSEGEEWTSLLQGEALEIKFSNDKELIEQYRIEHGKNCKLIPSKDRDVWICSCGGINKFEETECHKCKSSFDVLNSVNFDELAERKKLRLEEKARQAAQYKMLADANRRILRKRIAVIIPVIAVLIVGGVLILNFGVKKSSYDSAVQLRNSGKYEEAISAFELLEDFKDSPEQIKQTKYEFAINMFKSGDDWVFDDAVRLLEELGDYKDSKSVLEKEIINKQKDYYEQGIENLEMGYYSTAKTLFERAGAYKDSYKILNAIELYRQALDSEASEAYEMLQKTDIDYGCIGEAKEKIKRYAEFSGVWRLESGSSKTLAIRYDYASSTRIPADEIEVSVYWTGNDDAKLYIYYEYYMPNKIVSEKEYVTMRPNGEHTNDNRIEFFATKYPAICTTYLNSGKLIFEDVIISNGRTDLKAVYVKF